MRPIYALLLLSYLCVGCSSQQKVARNKDADYTVRRYGDHLWMTENLRITPWNTSSKAEVFYPNKEYKNVSQYGLLYNYESAQDICPDGWQLPSVDDFKMMLDRSQESQVKFDVELAGYGNHAEHPPLFGEKAILWTSDSDSLFAWTAIFGATTDTVRYAEQHLEYGFSVRCIKKN